jgi:HNH endonuclease
MPSPSRNRSVIEWRSIRGWPYEVSSGGFVRRIGGRMLKAIRRDRYLCVSLSRGSDRWRPAIHQLVCEAFHGDRPSPQHQVAHWNGDGTDNTSANLRWTTAKGNADDRGRHGNHAIGERNAGHKLTAETVAAILGSGLSGVQVARRFGISNSQAYRILHSQSWRQIAGNEAWAAVTVRVL